MDGKMKNTYNSELRSGKSVKTWKTKVVWEIQEIFLHGHYVYMYYKMSKFSD